ncbi:MAG: tRNA dihydrouridine synthase DusB [Candidatus Woesearchaeota archaeon]|jgi:tRNA-dihydrouridine synthase B
MNIGQFKLKNRISLAPMAEVTDIAFRELCIKEGCGFTITEMVNAHAIIHADENTLRMTKTSKLESPRCIQIFGGDHDAVIQAAKIVEKDCDILNFNMGCPVDKVTSINAGSALLKDLVSTKKLLTDLKSEIKIPLTIKTRIGYDDEINIPQVAKMCEEVGIDCLMIHGRTKAQGYFGNADWKSIETAKQNYSGPVIGNGDVIDEVSAKNMLSFCDGAMIGRAAIGNPFIFSRVTHFLETGNFLPKESVHDRISMYYKYVKLAEKYRIGTLVRLRQQAVWFCKGFVGSKDMRMKISSAKTYDDIKKAMDDFLSENT